jgi:hypothetical protein
LPFSATGHKINSEAILQKNLQSCSEFFMQQLLCPFKEQYLVPFIFFENSFKNKVPYGETVTRQKFKIYLKTQAELRPVAALNSTTLLHLKQLLTQ